MPGILVPVDFSDVTDAVVAEARKMAAALSLPLTLIHVAQAEVDFIGYEVGPQYIRDDLAEDLREQHQALQTLRDTLAAEGLTATAQMVPGSAQEKVVEELGRIQPELVVVGSHGHGALYHLLAGSVCQAVLTHAACPVLVVPAKAS